MLRFFREHQYVSPCFVNDGSADATSETLDKLVFELGDGAHVLHLPTNVGKGEAVRQGALQVLKRDDIAYLAYWDADLATPLEELPRFLERMEAAPEIVWVSGARIRRLGASIDRRFLRHYLGRIFATIVSLLLRLPVYDTQCGAKLLRAETARALFAAPFVSKWIFDVELIARLILQNGRDAALQSMYEMPLLHWKDVSGTKLKKCAFAKAALDLARIAVSYCKAIRRRTIVRS